MSIGNPYHLIDEWPRAVAYNNLKCWKIVGNSDPHKEKHTIKDITHRIKNEGFSGVAIDPLHARIQADDEKYYPIYTECCNLNDEEGVFHKVRLLFYSLRQDVHLQKVSAPSRWYLQLPDRNCFVEITHIQTIPCIRLCVDRKPLSWICRC